MGVCEREESARALYYGHQNDFIVEPENLYMPGKHSTAELYFQTPFTFFFILRRGLTKFPLLSSNLACNPGRPWTQDPSTSASSVARITSLSFLPFCYLGKGVRTESFCGTLAWHCLAQASPKLSSQQSLWDYRPWHIRLSCNLFTLPHSLVYWAQVSCCFVLFCLFHLHNYFHTPWTLPLFTRQNPKVCLIQYLPVVNMSVIWERR